MQKKMNDSYTVVYLFYSAHEVLPVAKYS